MLSVEGKRYTLFKLKIFTVQKMAFVTYNFMLFVYCNCFSNFERGGI